MGCEAVAINQETKSSIAAAVALDSGTSDALAEVAQTGCLDISAGLEDEHFAVSEAAIDSARAQQTGWLSNAHSTFRQEHGQIVETSAADPEDDDIQEEELCCARFLCPGVCRKQLRPSFFTLLEQIKQVLRQARQVRRTSGYLPNHPCILWCQRCQLSGPLDSRDVVLQSVQDVMMLTRVNFSPFDCTALQFDMLSGGRATMRISESGVPEFLAMPEMILRFAERADIVLMTASYRAMSLRDIIVLDVCNEDAPHAQADQANGESSSDSAVDELAERSALLRSVAPGNKRKTKISKKSRPACGVGGARRASAVPDPAQNNQPNKKRKRAARGELGDDDNAQAQPDSSDSVDQALIYEWQAARDAQDGPAPSSAAPTGAKRPASAPALIPSHHVPTTPAPSSSGAPPSGVPIVSKTFPWRDESGYCWVYRESTQKPYHLGA